MTETPGSDTIEPIRASLLLDLEGRHLPGQDANTGPALSAAHQRGIMVAGLDKRVAQIWNGKGVVGIGSVGGGNEAGQGKVGAAMLLTSSAISALLRPSTEALGTQATPTVYIVAPHTTQTVPILHVHLANTISNSQAAIELLRPVRLLQYFDLAGLAESVTEISETLYQALQEQVFLPGKGTNDSLAKSLVLIQGIGPTVSATYRRSGLVQANALLAGLIRNVTQLSRSSNDMPVVVEIPVEIEDHHDWQQHGDAVKPRTSRSMEMDSAFSGSTNETLRLACGHETLSKTLEAGLDSVVVIHDGLGRITHDRKRKDPLPQVVEVIKDRSGDLAGLWDIWQQA